MIKNFIKLHATEDNSVVVTRVEDIIFVNIDEDSKDTTIYFDNDTLESVTVNETPEKVYQNILDCENTDFIKVHSSDDNKVLIININSIAIINQTEENNKRVSAIYFDSDSFESVTVNESPERIYTMMDNNPDTSTNKLDSVEMELDDITMYLYKENKSKLISMISDNSNTIELLNNLHKKLESARLMNIQLKNIL